MAIDWSRKVASANRMLNKYGSARTLIKRVKSGDPAKPVITDLPVPCVGIEFDATTEDIDGTTVLMGDKLAYVAPSLTTEAVKGDSFIDKLGVRYRIEKVEKLAPDGVVLLWTYLLRK